MSTSPERHASTTAADMHSGEASSCPANDGTSPSSGIQGDRVLLRILAVLFVTTALFLAVVAFFTDAVDPTRIWILRQLWAVASGIGAALFIGSTKVEFEGDIALGPLTLPKGFVTKRRISLTGGFAVWFLTLFFVPIPTVSERPLDPKSEAEQTVKRYSIAIESLIVRVNEAHTNKSLIAGLRKDLPDSADKMYHVKGDMRDFWKLHQLRDAGVAYAEAAKFEALAPEGKKRAVEYSKLAMTALDGAKNLTDKILYSHGDNSNQESRNAIEHLSKNETLQRIYWYLAQANASLGLVSDDPAVKRTCANAINEMSETINPTFLEAWPFSNDEVLSQYSIVSISRPSKADSGSHAASIQEVAARDNMSEGSNPKRGSLQSIPEPVGGTAISRGLAETAGGKKFEKENAVTVELVKSNEFVTGGTTSAFETGATIKGPIFGPGGGGPPYVPPNATPASEQVATPSAPIPGPGGGGPPYVTLDATPTSDVAPTPSAPIPGPGGGGPPDMTPDATSVSDVADTPSVPIPGPGGGGPPYVAPDTTPASDVVATPSAPIPGPGGGGPY